MLQINNVKLKSDIIIAPMAGITNGAFREICYEFGAGLVYTEMVSDKAIFYNNKKTLDMLEIDDKFHPISLQLFGSDVDTMVYAAKILDKKTNCDIIDINMGCPVNKVIKTGAGSALMLDEEKAVNIVSEIVKNVDKPVTVKMRLGWTNDKINYLSLAKKLENIGVSAIALHARTRSQMYEGKANWEHIKTLKENLTIPVFGNGDVTSVEDYIKMKEMTNCDGVMIGRGIVGNPFLIKEISDYLEGKEVSRTGFEERFSYCLKHAQKLVGLKGEKLGIAEMRGLAPHYITGLYMATKYKAMMNTMQTYQDLENILNEYGLVLKEYEEAKYELR